MFLLHILKLLLTVLLKVLLKVLLLAVRGPDEKTSGISIKGISCSDLYEAMLFSLKKQWFFSPFEIPFEIPCKSF